MARQQTFPTMKQKRITEVEDAAELYRIERNKRMKATEKEVAAKAKLIEVMKKAGITIYRDDDHKPPLLVLLSAGADKVQVKDVEDDEPEEPEPEAKKPKAEA